MFKSSTNRQGFVGRTGSHSTKPSARGRLDAPWSAPEAVEYFNPIGERWDSLLKQCADVEKRLASAPPHERKELEQLHSVLLEEAGKYRVTLRREAIKPRKPSRDKIYTPADLRALRILTGMGVTEMGRLLGVSRLEVRVLEQKTTRFVLNGHIDKIIAFKSFVDQYVADEIANAPREIPTYEDDHEFRRRAPDLAWMAFNSVHLFAAGRIAAGVFASGRPRPLIALSREMEMFFRLAAIPKEATYADVDDITRFANIECERRLGECVTPILIDYSNLDELDHYEPQVAQGLRFNEAHRMLIARVADGWHHMGVERPTIVPFIFKAFRAFLEETGEVDGLDTVKAWAMQYKGTIHEIPKDPQPKPR